MAEVFTFIFKYRPFYFWEGDFSFLAPISVWFLALVAILLIAGLYFAYRPGTRGGALDRVTFLLRSLLLLFLLLLLMRPSLTLSTLEPQQTTLVLLVDNSKSIAIQEETGSRAEPVRALLGEGSEFMTALEKNFILRKIQFDSSARKFESGESLTFDGEQTNISSGLKRVLTETRNLPVGGVVLITDGADNSYRNSREEVAELIARGIPIHTVGIGPEQLNRDVEIESISSPREVLPGSVAVARVTLRHRGYGGARGTLRVREGSTLLESVEVYLPHDSDVLTTEVKLFPDQEGVREYEFEFVPLAEESITENNRRQAMIRATDSRPRLLIVEGRPRWEYKFLRQALMGDEYLHVESLLRTALNKYYRQGIEQETTLASGFPTRREELFSYKGLVLGDVESAFFTYPQMEMLRDFVGRRGGGLLMLGGASTLSNGGYKNTPIEEVLPVSLGNSPSSSQTGIDDYHRVETRIARTEYGRNHPALRLGRTVEQDENLWSLIPSLSDRNGVGGLKAGATALIRTAPLADGVSGDSAPVLVSHRYGRGLSLVFLSGSSWRWQMLQDHEDRSHETFWRQLLRWLVNSATDPVSVEVDREVYSQNEPVQIRVEVNDESFNRINDARLEGLISTPNGETQPFSLHWDPEEEGVYKAEWLPNEDGLYRVEVAARAATQAVDSAPPQYGRATTFFMTTTGQGEYFSPIQNRGYLEALASETGGRYYTLENVANLPEEILYRESRSSVTRILDLWDMPFNLMLMLGLLFAEWLLRKKRGLI